MQPERARLQGIMPALRSPFVFRTDLRLRLIGPVILFLTGVMFFRLKMYIDLEPHFFLNQILIALSAGYTGWELCRITSLYIQRRQPGLQRIGARIIRLSIAMLILAHFGYAIRVLLHYVIDGRPWVLPSLVDYSDTTGVLIFYTTVTLCIYETGYLVQQWKKTAVEKEGLIQSAWQAKYDLLKAQINPHFLFNSLNSLSSLISEDPAKAEEFTDEMSKVYRYLLRANEQELVTLGTELQFINSYCNLLKVRHGNAFIYHPEVDRSFHNYLIPALTLQLLVENAVKHNIVSKQQPLTVTIKATSHLNLIVQNNLQKKKSAVQLNGMGLNNIRAKYSLLKKGNISIVETSDEFIVSVPLLQNTPELLAGV